MLRFWVKMVSLEILPHLSSYTMAGEMTLSASHTNEYQESSWGGKELPARKADKLTVICESIV
jgi:hypothetical protein